MVYGALIAVSYLNWAAVWSSDDRDGSNTLRLIQADIEANEKIVQKSSQQIAEYNSALKQFSLINDQPDWGLLLGLISKMCGEDVVLSRCVIGLPKPVLHQNGQPASNGGAIATAVNGSENKILELQGYGNSQKAIAQLALKLEASGLFESVSIGKTTRENFGKIDAMSFKMECPLKLVGEVRTPESEPGPPMPMPAKTGKEKLPDKKELKTAGPSSVANTRDAGDE